MKMNGAKIIKAAHKFSNVDFHKELGKLFKYEGNSCLIKWSEKFAKRIVKIYLYANLLPFLLHNLTEKKQNARRRRIKKK